MRLVRLLVETVGVGQTELDIMKLADTTVVALVPESGDAIQTMKAGLMEIRRHRATLEACGVLDGRRTERRRSEFEPLLIEGFEAKVERNVRAGEPATAPSDVADGRVDPYSAVEAIVGVMLSCEPR